MSDPSTADRVIKAIGKVVEGREIEIDNSLEELGVDSLAAIEIMFEVEEEFDFDIPGDAGKMSRLKTVRDVVDGVERLLAGDAEGFFGEEPEAEGDAGSGAGDGGSESGADGGADDGGATS